MWCVTRPSALDRLQVVARRTDGLHLLLLHGSRARENAHERSDWDIGYLGDEALDRMQLLADIVDGLGTDDVDLVDLDRASALLRFRAAREGVLVYENPSGTHQDFVVTAALHWYEIEPIVRRTHDALLADLGR